MFTSFYKFIVQSVVKGILLTALFSLTAFGLWESSVTTEKNKWYYSRSEISLPFNDTDEELTIEGRMIVACNKAKILHVYMKFNAPLKLADPIQLTDRNLYEAKIYFYNDMPEITTAVLYRKKSTVLEFADDEELTKDFQKNFEILVILPWRNKGTLSFPISLEGANEEISTTLQNCGIEFEDEY